MINFIKNLLGLNKPTETVKEILTPPVKSDPVVTAVTAATYVEPAKPVIAKKVKAISSPAPAKAKPAVQKPAVTEGKNKGGNNVVKQQPKQTAKPQAPKSPRPKQKAKRK